MSVRVDINNLSVDQDLYDLIENQIMPDAGVSSDAFWGGLADIIATMADRNRELLDIRDDFQKKIDQWYLGNPQIDYSSSEGVEKQKIFLREIGYLSDEADDFSVTTENVDEEIASIAGPQLVVPVDNDRYALNAVNARWNSLYDALYSSDVILEVEGCKKASKYNPVRGVQVIKYVRNFLDQVVPLAVGSHGYAVKYMVVDGDLKVIMGDGSKTSLGLKECFMGYKGDMESPSHILLRHNHLHIDICIGEGHFIGRGDLANVYDVQVESALTTIMDCEDSVSAVDVEDKIQVYRNWAGLMRGDLTATWKTANKTVTRQLEKDREYTTPNDNPLILPGRSVMLVRNVGAHMYTDAVTYNGQEVPETFLDAMVTALAACHDFQKKGHYRNSRKGSMYIVKPKVHGPEEVAEAVKLFGRVEAALGLPERTLKIGIMDEEKRTTVNLKACIKEAQDRIIFINTGFLDRTGDEIHTNMMAGAVFPKDEIKTQPWILAYEDWNVEVGLQVGMSGRGQIGKGMWAAPDNMTSMIEQKILHPRSGANTSWVPSPVAATLHSMHYHFVNVDIRQKRLSTRRVTKIDKLLSMPTMESDALADLKLNKELENNIQGILGYVVKWINDGIGCSKVLDINDVYLMEDRATLRISSQHIANWLYHGLVDEQQVIDTLKVMAQQVDRQNVHELHYIPFFPDYKNNVAFQAACDLIFQGQTTPNGYTEYVLHNRRREFKRIQKSLSSS